ncbi:heme oxygenase-like protein [Fistulina hepatica ATCC 64428]|uniref:Heme oxygenase-like protein n=1 Tax=Fistulina hepatica ATCC 64428 TaxID=1128425 RepID=A0A0D7A5C4_9AGAR|nr:heme oxygenase-like protein [Fistulina hepatica ATCC 64428]
MELTSHLLQSASASGLRAAATQDPTFIRSIKDQTISPRLLAYWLAQDKIYAQAYPRFIADLMTRMHPDPPPHADNVLLHALQNITRELGFFNSAEIPAFLRETTWQERKATRDYTAEMYRMSNDASQGEALVFLWAMEKVYLDVWTGVRQAFEDIKGFSTQTEPANVNQTTQACTAFAAHWSSPDFADFVEELATLVNGLNISQEKAESVWRRVLELEVAFWPEEWEVDKD